MKKSKCDCSVQWGLIGGSFLALVHLVWSLAIAITQQGAQQFLTWVLELHRISTTISIKPFDLLNAILLVVVTFVFGFIFGFVISKIATAVQKKCN